MNFTQISHNGNKFLTNKRDRILSDYSNNSETNKEDEDFPLYVIKPSTQYAQTFYDEKSQGLRGLNSKPELNGHNKYLSTAPRGVNSRKNSRLSETKFSCNCKNSQCLKFYCECFSTMLYCDPKVCSCKNCMNNSDNEPVRSEAINNYFAKSPGSFKKIMSTQTFDKNTVTLFDINSSFRGCTCKKSFCLKKYCECYQAGYKCSSQCKCYECKNVENDYFLNSTSSNANMLMNQSSRNKLTNFSILSNNGPEHERNNNSSNKDVLFDQFEIKKEILVPYKIIINDYLITKEYENDN